MKRKNSENIRDHRMGSACPLLASAPIAEIVRKVSTARNDVFFVRYEDGQTLEIHARPESTDERIREIASAQ